ncbi:MAG: VOC family protein [Gaiellaceae bacterium]
MRTASRPPGTSTIPVAGSPGKGCQPYLDAVAAEDGEVVADEGRLAAQHRSPGRHSGIEVARRDHEARAQVDCATAGGFRSAHGLNRLPSVTVERRSNVIIGAHAVVFSQDAERARAFFREVLGFPSVDAGGGWLIFALPPAELAAHPADDGPGYQLYLMCDDVRATVDELRGKGAEFSRPISDEGFGLLTAIELPGGGELGLYEPKHPSPLHW